MEWKWTILYWNRNDDTVNIFMQHVGKGKKKLWERERERLKLVLIYPGKDWWQRERKHAEYLAWAAMQEKNYVCSLSSVTFLSTVDKDYLLFLELIFLQPSSSMEEDKESQK